MAEKTCVTRPGRLERRAEEIAAAIRDEIVKAGANLKIGEININISILNGGVGHCKISNSRSI